MKNNRGKEEERGVRGEEDGEKENGRNTQEGKNQFQEKERCVGTVRKREGGSR